MKGILVVNLGTPDKPYKKEVKSYLSEFLMDKYVIDINPIGRTLLVKGIILNTRPKKSAEAYQKIWTERGSPLMFHTEDLVAKIKQKVTAPVEMAMRYNKPSIQSGIEKLVNQNCTEIFVLSLYPQYAMSSTLTVEEKVLKEAKKIRPSLKIEFLKPFYNHPEYIQILSNKIKKEWDNDEYDYLLFSYHGIPVRHLIKTDPTKSHCTLVDNCCSVDSKAHATCYKHQSFEITKAVVKKLNLNDSQYESSFQSRLGRAEWINPDTAIRLEELPNEGKKKILVVTPSFVADCLETIEEIAMEGKKEFLHHGGEKFNTVACLNSDDEFRDFLVNRINEFL